VRRGNVLVAVQAADNRATEVTKIMERTGLIDIEREADTWRSSGWKGFDETDTTVGNNVGTRPISADRMTARTTNSSPVRDNANDETIEVVEESLQVGKRAVETGGVRVTSQMREVPVEEEVRLRQEHVEIERRPVDRPATTADLNNFREGSIEVRETQEEAVIAKDARVVEEIRVRKNVDEHTETVRDTVRRTEVDVEQLGGNGRATNGKSMGFDTYMSDFRNHYQTTYSSAGGKYDRYQPAYQYGYNLANDDRYRNRNWNDIEAEVRTSWDKQNQNTWEDFKDAVHYSWDKVRGKV
jgi:uncharacterized protein (TIGR02271 family)